jgi:hypothetical protein
VLSGNILTTATTGNIFPSNATTINLGLAATALNIGAGSGTTTVNNNLQVDGNLTIDGTFVAPSADFGNIQIAVTDNQTINTSTGELRLGSATGDLKLAGIDTVYTDQSSFFLLNSPTTITAFDSATSLTIGETTGFTFIRNDLTVGGDLKINGNDIKSSSGATAITLSGNDVVIADDLTITGNTLNLAQGTDILYSEAGNRLNRPVVRSTTGNTSGFRVEAPNATTSAVSTISAFNTNDSDNGKFINISARGALTADLRIQTGQYTGGILGPSGSVVSFVDNATTYATVNPAGPTDPLDLATKAYVDAQELNTTYTINASTATGGANFNLVGSDSTTDTIKFAGSGATTVTRTDANTITIATTVADPTKLVNGLYEFVLNADGTVTTPSEINASGPLTLKGGVVDPTTVVIDNTSLVATFDETLPGGDVAVLTATNGSLQWAHTAGGSVFGSVNGTWTLNANGTTSFPNFTFPYADGTSNQVLRTNGSGVLSWYSPSDANTTYTIDATSTTGGANFNLVGSDSTTDTIKFAGSGATTVTRTDANTITISSTDTNTTYTQDASSTTGGANLNLVGSDSTTDSVKFAGGTNVTVTATDANTITIAATDTNTTYTQDVSSTTGGANLNLVGSDSTTDSVKFAGGTNVTVVATDANTMTINATDTNTTYDFNASSTTGGANLNLVGSDSTTDSVKISNGTGVSVAQISGTEVSVAIGQSVGTGDTPSFAGVSAGNLTVGVATDNTIASTDTNGNIVLDPNGTGHIVLSAITRAQGEMQASTNLNYVFPPQSLNTVTDNNGYSAASSMPAGTNGYGANAGFIHYSGDTLAAGNTTGAFNFRLANGNSTTDTVPFTGIAGVAPSAVLSGAVLGSLNYNGYATTGFNSEIATANQGGGITALHNAQIQTYMAENCSDSTLTLTSTNVTAVASSFRAALTTPSVTGTKGQISFGATTPGVGNAIRVTGTLTGTATGIVSGQVYYIIATASTTTATLSATPGGSPINTTAGTLTGLTLTRCGVTFTTTGLTNIPFGRGALVTVSNVTNVTNGTYPVFGNPTLTSFSLGIPHTVAPTLPGTQTFSCLTTYGAGGFRVRAYPAAIPQNIQNRMEVVDMTAASTTFRSDAFTFNTGAYGNTGVGVTGNNISYNRVYGQWQYNTLISPVAANTAYVFPLGTPDFNNIATVGSTSRLIPGAAGLYNMQFSVQINNADNGSEHFAYIWLRKNGADVTNSMGRVGVVKNGDNIASWNYMLSSNNTTDYYELAYAVDSTQITFPVYAATAFGPSTATLITTLTPVGA